MFVAVAMLCGKPPPPLPFICSMPHRQQWLMLAVVCWHASPVAAAGAEQLPHVVVTRTTVNE